LSAADLARLELAKRAYEATQPTTAEVQTGVRRARLARRRPRRNWFSKGLVLVVLAVGGMAYAKPHAMGELVEQMLPTRGADSSQRARPLRAPAPKPVVAPERAPATPAPDVEPPHTEGQDPQKSTPAPPAVPSKRTQKGARLAPAPASPSGGSAEAGVSDWGRVGRALARGDDESALSALRQLSDSDDASTRDKADLGRAQLFMAHGQSEQACAILRSLLQRGVEARIERQAQASSKSCAR
jgi:hypothetical protein